MVNRRNKPIWTVPRIWSNADCFILGGGPSLKEIDVSRLTGSRVIAVNNAYRLGSWIDVLYFGDCRWYNWHKKELLQFAGLKVTTCEQHVDKPGIKVVRRKNAPHGLQTNPAFLGWNLSSGACAINLAVHLGAKRIVLLGYDMRKVEGQCNFHDDYPHSRNKDPYKRFLVPFPTIAADLKKKHIECLNACPGSALTVFPIVDPGKVVPRC